MTADLLWGIALGSVLLIGVLGWYQLHICAERMNADRNAFQLLLNTIEHSIHVISGEIAQSTANNVFHHVSIIRTRITSFTPHSDWGEGFHLRLRRVNMLLMVVSIHAVQKNWVAAKDTTHMAVAVFQKLKAELQGE